MLLATTLLIIGTFSGLSTAHSIVFGWGGDEVADKETDPEGHDRDNLFGVRLTIALLVGAGLSAILGY